MSGKQTKQGFYCKFITSNTSSKHLKPRNETVNNNKKVRYKVCCRKCTNWRNMHWNSLSLWTCFLNLNTREEALWERTTLCPVENCKTTKWAVSTSVTLPLTGKQLAGTNHVWHKQTTNITLYSDIQRDTKTQLYSQLSTSVDHMLPFCSSHNLCNYCY